MNESGASETSKGMVLVNAAVVDLEWHSYLCRDTTGLFLLMPLQCHSMGKKANSNNLSNSLN